MLELVSILPPLTPQKEPERARAYLGIRRLVGIPFPKEIIMWNPDPKPEEEENNQSSMEELQTDLDEAPGGDESEAEAEESDQPE